MGFGVFLSPLHSNPVEEENRRCEARAFVTSLQARVDTAEDSLMKSMEHILPILRSTGKVSRITASELTHALLSLHDIHTRQIQRFASLMGDDSLSKEYDSKTPTGAGTTGRTGDTPYHWSLGMPLESVVETDNETDRNSCGSIASSKRSASFCRTPGSDGSGTPLTPSINGLRLR